MKKIQCVCLFLLLVVSSHYIVKAEGIVESSLTDSIPNGAIPIEYDSNMKRAVLLIGSISGDAHKIFFDTGVYGLIVADSLDIWDETDNPKYLQIAGWRKEYYSYPKGNLDKMTVRNPVFSWFGIGAIVGWDFFDGKIIELSYKDKYIRELNNTDNLSGYQRLPMKRESDKWGVEITISLQGKEIKEYAMVDIGNTSTLTLNSDIIEKYAINMDDTSEGKTSTVAGGERRSILEADTIKAGKDYITKQRIAFRGIERRSPFAGLLGNVFFENFSVVFDFKNYNLYLKRNE